jgi:hypothetical protein
MAEFAIRILLTGNSQYGPSEPKPTQQIDRGTDTKEWQAQPHQLESWGIALNMQAAGPRIKRRPENQHTEYAERSEREYAGHAFRHASQCRAPVGAADVLDRDPRHPGQRQAQQVVANEQEVEPDSLWREE